MSCRVGFLAIYLAIFVHYLVLLESRRIEAPVPRDPNEICNLTGNNSSRTRRDGLSALDGFVSDAVDYACFDGSLSSCFATMGKLLPTRLYINLNTILDDLFGLRGPAATDYLRAAGSRAFLNSSILATNITMRTTRLHLANVRKRTLILKHQVRIALDVFCKYLQEESEEAALRQQNTTEVDD